MKKHAMLVTLLLLAVSAGVSFAQEAHCTHHAGGECVTMDKEVDTNMTPYDYMP